MLGNDILITCVCYTSMFQNCVPQRAPIAHNVSQLAVAAFGVSLMWWNGYHWRHIFGTRSQSRIASCFVQKMVISFWQASFFKRWCDACREACTMCSAKLHRQRNARNQNTVSQWIQSPVKIRNISENHCVEHSLSIHITNSLEWDF